MWFNDYQILNSNMVTDSHPLPHIDDILANCGKGKIWSKMDMTNSFFQTWVHADDVHLTTVMTPHGLFEWVVMPMELKNFPPICQRRMASALKDHIGKICHIYLDDIIIWSTSIPKHIQHINSIIQSLQSTKLFCNVSKCEFFSQEIDFLRHHISA
jgi:Reverse transcriptase (RNA-dependent DNA polymerase)